MFDQGQILFLGGTGSPCICYDRGSYYYEPILSDGCLNYVKHTAFGEPETLSCPSGKAFNLDSCICEDESSVVCPTECPTSNEHESLSKSQSMRI